LSLASDPAYKVAFELNDIRIYIPVEATQYHVERYVHAQNQQIYSESGATKEYLSRIIADMIRVVEDKTTTEVRSTIATLCNNVRMRLAYPVDEECAIRMGAILSFMEDENPNKVDEWWTNKKVELAKSAPEFYSFFLTLGIANTPSYKSHSGSSIDMDYFRKRKEMLQGLTLPTL
jgi:hypothetical protein